MTEKGKREKGLIYNPNYDAELRGEMVKAQDLCYEYNNIKPSETTARIEKLNQIKNILFSKAKVLMSN